MSGGDEERPSPRREAPSRADRALGPLLSDSTLWPVLLTGMIIGATLFGSVILTALRERSLAAVGALLGLAWLTAAPLSADLRRRRLGPATGLALVLWALSAAVAVVGAVTGFL